MKPILFHPRDVLFFRDARPMRGASAGDGAEWPLPSVLHSAMLSAFHERWPTIQSWESRHVNWTEKERGKFQVGQAQENITSSLRFGGLRTVGPFPVRRATDGTCTTFVPTPADLMPAGRLMPVSRCSGVSRPPRTAETARKARVTLLCVIRPPGHATLPPSPNPADKVAQNGFSRLWGPSDAKKRDVGAEHLPGGVRR